MDAGRFDALSKSLAARHSRRSLGAGGLAAGLLAALGVEPAAAATNSCALTILATTAAGAHKDKTYAGALTLQIGDGGAIDDGRFDLDDGTRLALVGQATGRALNLRITLADGGVLEFNGTAANDLILCRGAVSGVFGGPQDTDIGAWRTTQAGSNGGSSTTSGTSGSNPSGGNASGGGGNAAGDAACASGVVCTGVCCQAAPGLTPDGMACNAGACECTYSCQAAGCPGAAQGTIVITCGSDPQPQCHSACPVPADAGCGGMTCPDGQTLDVAACACVAPSGAPCAGTLVLCQGRCVPACDLGGVLDPATCVCGAAADPCGGACAAGESCVGGVCQTAQPPGGAVVCALGQTDCGGFCTNLQHDPFNCGACGTGCDSLCCRYSRCALPGGLCQ